MDAPATRSRLKGVMVPCITPFDQAGQLDQGAFRPYLDFLVEHVHAISVGAIYGSGPLMDLTQRQQLFDVAAATIAGRAFFSAFVGAPDTDTAVRLARHAESAGADAVSCVAPFYYKQVDEALYRHYLALVEAVSIPVFAYDSPIYAGNRLSMQLVTRLAHQGMAGLITGAAGDGIERVWAALRHIPNESFSVWSIRDGLALPALLMGARGFESGVGNFFPELVMQFYDAVIAGRMEQATTLQQRMLQVRDISHRFGRNIPTLHALIRLRGFETGVPRRPFFVLSDEEVAILQSDLRNLDFDTPFV